MASEQGAIPFRLVIEVDPELEDRLKRAAANRGLPVRDYVVTELCQLVADSPDPGRLTRDQAWRRLSVPAFDRDWESDADAIYDDMVR